MRRTTTSIRTEPAGTGTGTPRSRRRSGPSRTRAGAVVAAAALATAVLVTAAPGHAGAAIPYAANCPSTEQNPTTDPAYGIPIRNQISNGVLTQGTSTITNINASVCGILQFPSLSATIPAADIIYGTATATLGGAVSVGSVQITANGPSTAVTSNTPAPNGGLVFTLTAHTFNKINVGLNLGALGGTGGITVPSLPVTVPSLPVTVPTLPGGITVPSLPVTVPTLPVTIPSLPISLPGGTLAAVSCDATLDATLNTAPGANSSPLVGSLATGANGTAYAPKGSVAISGLTPDPSSPLGPELCPLVQSILGVPETTTATFKAPISFFSTLNSF